MDDEIYLSAAQRKKRTEELKSRHYDPMDEPIEVATKVKIATSFWGQSWCQNLVMYETAAHRLPAGRKLLRDGGVIDLKINAQTITAKVISDRLYHVQISIEVLDDEQKEMWQTKLNDPSYTLMDRLYGRLPEDLKQQMIDRDSGIFPSLSAIRFSCECVDDADVCEHVAASLYAVAIKFDTNPALFFPLRGLSLETSAPEGFTIDHQMASEIFGIDILV
jgi:uncharacterized Zn finger protein